MRHRHGNTPLSRPLNVPVGARKVLRRRNKHQVHRPQQPHDVQLPALDPPPPAPAPFECRAVRGRAAQRTNNGGEFAAVAQHPRNTLGVQRGGNGGGAPRQPGARAAAVNVPRPTRGVLHAQVCRRVPPRQPLLGRRPRWCSCKASTQRGTRDEWPAAHRWQPNQCTRPAGRIHAPQVCCGHACRSPWWRRGRRGRGDGAVGR
mmetsp:Transcript_20279/g.60250  ORF Transcript_20279/g.60250 Transcript_20279/m.60250 type:complete len:203 (-) Transcript_20279:1033-1641(-)